MNTVAENPWLVSGIITILFFVIMSVRFLSSLKLENKVEDYILNDFIRAGNHMPVRTAIKSLSEEFHVSYQEILGILQRRILPKKILVEKKIHEETCFLKPQ